MHHSTTTNTSRVIVCTFMLKISEHSGQNFLSGSSGIQLGPGPPSFEKRPDFSIQFTKNTSNTSCLVSGTCYVKIWFIHKTPVSKYDAI